MLGSKLHSTVKLPKQRQAKVDWYELLCFGSPTVHLASQHVWFCTMWPDRAKGVLYAAVVFVLWHLLMFDLKFYVGIKIQVFISISCFSFFSPLFILCPKISMGLIFPRYKALYLSISACSRSSLTSVVASIPVDKLVNTASSFHGLVNTFSSRSISFSTALISYLMRFEEISSWM